MTPGTAKLNRWVVRALLSHSAKGGLPLIWVSRCSDLWFGAFWVPSRVFPLHPITPALTQHVAYLLWMIGTSYWIAQGVPKVGALGSNLVTWDHRRPDLSMVNAEAEEGRAQGAACPGTRILEK